MPQFPANNSWKPTWTSVVPVTAAAGATTTQTFTVPCKGRFIDGYLINNNAVIPVGDSWNVKAGATAILAATAPAGGTAAQSVLRADTNLAAGTAATALLSAGSVITVNTVAAGGSTFTGGLLCLVYEQD